MANHDRIDHVKLADELVKGNTLRASMLAAGHTKATASQGRKSISSKTYTELTRRGKGYILLGKAFKPDERADLVRGKLVENVLLGQDKGVRSVELMGKDVEVGIFKPDSSTTQVQINMPVAFAKLIGATESVQEPEE